MHTRGFIMFFLGALAVLLPLLFGARVSPGRSGATGAVDARVILKIDVVKVENEVRSVGDLLTIPEAARWVVIKNNSGGVLFVGTDNGVTRTTGWPLGSGEEFTFSPEKPVFLLPATGAIAVPVMIGR